MYKKNISGFFLVILLFFIIWSGIQFYNNQITNNKITPEIFESDINLSTVPNQLEDSLKKLETKAKRKQFEIGSGFFNLDFLYFKDTILKTTPLILKIYYKASDKTEENIVEMPEAFVGLSQAQLESILNNWQIENFEPETGLILYKSLNKLSPEEENYKHLGIKGGYIAIFYGKQGNENLKEITDISVNFLPESEKKRLSEGIVVESDADLITILEGLVSYSQD